MIILIRSSDHKLFGRIKPVSSLLGHICQSQPKNLRSSLYNRFIMLSHKATVFWYRAVTSALYFAIQRLILCPLGKTAGTFVLNKINDNIGVILQNLNLDFRMPWDKLEFNIGVNHTNSIINHKPSLDWDYVKAW